MITILLSLFLAIHYCFCLFLCRQPSKSLPSNDDIFRLYHSLVYKSAIIVVCINEEMSFQAYVYRFTT